MESTVPVRPPPARLPWRPIEDLPPDRAALSAVAVEVSAMRRNWAAKGREIEAAGAAADSSQRQVRRWSIAAGMLEGIYSLDDGPGGPSLAASRHEAAADGEEDLPGSHLVDVLRDHERAVEGMLAFVAANQPITTAYIKDLHRILTAHQEFCEAADQFGNRMRVRLRRGEWKTLPSRPSPGTSAHLHEQCPPEHVASEMDRLVVMHARHENLEPEVAAAWLHHRLTQIGPFQDGNGRVARALATIVLLQKGGFPLVVPRDHEDAYAAALRAADEGEFVRLVELVCRLEKHALLRATEHADLASAPGLDIGAILADAGLRVRAAALRRGHLFPRVAESLRARTAGRLREVASKVAAAMRDVDDASADVVESTPDSEFQVARQLGETTRVLGYAATPSGRKPWVRLDIRHGGADSALLLVSFHGVGAPESGVWAACAFVVRGGASAGIRAEPCCTEPFTFTGDRELAAVESLFDAWLERAITLGLEIWRRSL